MESLYRRGVCKLREISGIAGDKEGIIDSYRRIWGGR